MKATLTDALLRTLRPPGSGRAVLRDAKVAGLELRLSATGSAAWSARGTLPDGRRVRVTLGDYPAVGLAEARRLALDALGRIAAGHDPVAARRAARAAREAARAEAEALGPTVAQRWREWTDHASRTARRGRGWSRAHAEVVARYFRLVIAPALGDRPLRMVTGQDWKALIADTNRARGPGAAGHAARAASAFLTHAAMMEWIEANPLARGAAARLAPPPAPRERALSDAELRLVWDAAASLGPKARAFVRLLILTGARRGEVAGLRAGEVDPDAGEWRLPPERSKSREGRAIPLGGLALSEVRAVWPEGGEAEARYLLGRFNGAPMSGFSKVKAALDSAIAALAVARGEAVPEDWRWHDLRRTCRTGLSRLGIGFEAAEAAIGHTVAKTTLARTYDRHDYRAEARDALLTWQGHVAAVVGGNVVSLAGRRAKA